MSVCELQFALHRACETDTSLGVGMEPKIADERRKREELRKNGRDLPFFSFVWKSAHFVGSFYASGCLIFVLNLSLSRVLGFVLLFACVDN